MIFIPEPIQFPIELLLAELLFAAGQKRRDHFLLRLLAGLALLLVFAALSNPEQESFVNVLRFLLLFVLSVVYLWQLFSINLWEAFFIGTAAYAVQHIAYNMATPLFLFAPFPEMDAGRTMLVLSMLAVYAAVYLIAYFFLGRKLNLPETHVRKNHSLILFVIVMLVLVIVLNYVRFMIRGDSSLTMSLLFSGYSVIGCIFALYIQFILLQRIEQGNRLEIAEQLLHMRGDQFRISEQTIDSINVKCHDLKYQLADIRKGLSDDQAASRFKDLEDSVEIYDSVIQTGNEALDVILTEKSFLCRSRGIQLTCMADGKALDMMNPADLYSLFGNIIDNAIESVADLEDPARRVISLTVRSTGNLALIHAENYYEHPIVMKNGLPQTTKADPRYHGFGMRSIQLIAEKYNGTLSIRTEDSLFVLNILLTGTAEENIA